MLAESQLTVLGKNRAIVILMPLLHSLFVYSDCATSTINKDTERWWQRESASNTNALRSAKIEERN